MSSRFDLPKVPKGLAGRKMKEEKGEMEEKGNGREGGKEKDTQKIRSRMKLTASVAPLKHIRFTPQEQIERDWDVLSPKRKSVVNESPL